MPEISLASGARFRADVGVPILDAAARENLLFPYSCRTGRCSTCKCRVLGGETIALQPETGLSDRERAEGWILSCVRSAISDLTLEVENLEQARLPPARTLPCRIARLEKMADDVIRVVLRLPPAADFRFNPGQYINVIGPGGIRRSYSMAETVPVDGSIELHIRAVTGGVMSEYWFNQARINDLLRFNGPLGTFFLHETAGLDLIFLATGTGIAPVKAMLGAIPELPAEQRPRSVTVLWGGSVESDLYMEIGALVGDHRYVPVLSRPAKNWPGARGHVQDVLLRSGLALANAAVYACGSNEMIRDARNVLVDAGLPGRRFHADAFVCSAPGSSAGEQCA